MILTGEGKPYADMAAYQPIEDSPRSDHARIIGAWISVTGKLMHEEPLTWIDHSDMPIDPDDRLIGDVPFKGWVGEDDSERKPSHFRPFAPPYVERRWRRFPFGRIDRILDRKRCKAADELAKIGFQLWEGVDIHHRADGKVVGDCRPHWKVTRI